LTRWRKQLNFRDEASPSARSSRARGTQPRSVPPNAQTHSSQPFTRVSVYLVALGVSACSAAPVELEFESGDTGDLKTGDGVRHASATPEEDGPSQPSPSVEPGFSPGPTCPAFPSACSDPDRPKCTVV